MNRVAHPMSPPWSACCPPILSSPRLAPPTSSASARASLGASSRDPRSPHDCPLQAGPRQPRQVLTTTCWSDRRAWIQIPEPLPGQVRPGTPARASPRGRGRTHARTTRWPRALASLGRPRAAPTGQERAPLRSRRLGAEERYIRFGSGVLRHRLGGLRQHTCLTPRLGARASIRSTRAATPAAHADRVPRAATAAGAVPAEESLAPPGPCPVAGTCP